MTKAHEEVEADYVIVGGGSAGCVLANRLSEDPANTVVLVEAGGEARAFVAQIPAGYARLVGNKRFDWLYGAEPDPTTGGRVQYWSAGRLLGGGSSINGQVYIRGTAADYDHWRDQGAMGWSYKDVLPYLRQIENWSGEPDPARGNSGPIGATLMREHHPSSHVFLNACRDMGLPTIYDYNRGQLEGAYLTQVSQRDGWRCSAEKGYLRPARSRPNLQVLTDSHADRIETENGRAIAVLVTRGDRTIRVKAHREVIVSAGTLGSPALLLRSGIGTAAAMRDAGISPVHDLAGVGRNFQEHPTVGIHKFVNISTLSSAVSPIDVMGYALKFLFKRSGPLTASIVHAMGLARTREGLEEPDIQLAFVPLSFDIQPDGRILMPKQPALNITASICHPKSRGVVTLKPDGSPRIRHRFYDDPGDMETLIGGAKFIERLFATPSFLRIVTGPRIPDATPSTDAAWEAYIRATSGIAYHPVGTCKMGTDSEAVVDPSLKVIGMAGLRVADASIMPRIISVNTNATAMMIGEKAADLIRAG
ncbi:GMC family oxidoreductase [Sphingobium fuliginis]|uniref:Choline dehydrogenase n=1 Tax=Sphingobium fuliginis (strain ATCC 27551) TaxID=336203 RepID=A0A292ZH40_SPHSA|nr:GMC family oxidoreductase N-terminal domain-containing protein [Sphingobium fuliginis]GAY22159.1 choline dehydrogenase [Sphingobium fuliginis]